MKMAACRLEKFTVFGNNYNTPDGSCHRDYLHVVDLAKVNILSCKRLFACEQTSPFEVFNVGTGNPIYVFEIIAVVEKISEKKLDYEIGSRRDGDVAVMYADVSKVNDILGWKVELGLEQMIKSSWQWEKKSGLPT
jgi:UDP-glucose 4-epimerase